MTTAIAQPPRFKTGLVLWLLGVAGGVLVLPYATALTSTVLQAAAAKKHIAVWQILVLQEVQLGVLLALAITIGLWAGRKLGLATPLLSAWLSGTQKPAKTGRTLLVAIAAGVIVSLIIVGLAKFAFADASRSLALHIAQRPQAWQGLLASVYGAFDEEILLRLGLLPILALAVRALLRLFGASRDVALPSVAFWTANILAAVAFGAGHLPAAAAITHLTPMLIARTLILNSLAGVVFGMLYRRYGLEWAFVSHFSADLVLHVLFI